MLTPHSTYSRLRPYMRKGDRSRRDMLDAARRLILAGGLEAASHAAIAGELNLSKGAVLYHFPTKQALWNGLIDEYANHLADDVVRFSQPFRDAGFTFEDSILPALYITSPLRNPTLLGFKTRACHWRTRARSRAPLRFSFPPQRPPHLRWFFVDFLGFFFEKYLTNLVRYSIIFIYKPMSSGELLHENRCP